GPRARHARAGGDGGEQVGALHADFRAGLLQARERRLEILVGVRHFRLQGVELRIGIQAPPGAARLRVGGLRLLPVAGFAIGLRRRRRFRRLVGRGEVAGGQGAAQRQRRRPGGGLHEALPLSCCGGFFGSGGGAMRTCTPSVIESGGFSTTLSSALRPSRISRLLPKSRPWVMFFSTILLPASTVATCRPAERNSTVLAGMRR